MIVEPQVFIILLNYNGAADTIDCLESLKEITYTNYKIIVVDNASTDDSLSRIEVAKKQYDFILIKNNVNGGFSAGNNIGIKYALKHGANYVLLLNNDTIVEKDFLSKAIDASENDSDVGLTIGKILFYSEPDKIWYGGGSFDKPYHYAMHLGFKESKDAAEWNVQKYISYATGCYFLLKRKAIEKIGLMGEEYFLYCEDTDYSIRATRSGFKLLYCPESVIYHKVSVSTGKGSDLSTYYIARNHILLYRKYLKGMDRAIAILYWYYKIMKSIRDGSRNRKPLVDGIRAGFRGESGKV